MAGLDMSRGIPRGRPSRKMPAPFVRPQVQISPPSVEQRRSWQWIAPTALAEGDVVPGMGLVHRVREVVLAPEYESGMAPADIVNAILWSVRIEAGVPEPQEYEVEASELIWAFSQCPVGASADGE